MRDLDYTEDYASSETTFPFYQDDMYEDTYTKSPTDINKTYSQTSPYYMMNKQSKNPYMYQYMYPYMYPYMCPCISPYVNPYSSQPIGQYTFQPMGQFMVQPTIHQTTGAQSTGGGQATAGQYAESMSTPSTGPTNGMTTDTYTAAPFGTSITTPSGTTSPGTSTGTTTGMTTGTYTATPFGTSTSGPIGSARGCTTTGQFYHGYNPMYQYPNFMNYGYSPYYFPYSYYNCYPQYGVNPFNWFIFTSMQQKHK